MNLEQAIERELATMEARVDALRGALQALRATNGSQPEAKPARAAKPRQKAAKGRIPHDATDKQVLAAVKAGHETPRAIVAETGLPDYNTRAALKRLLDAKTITRTGATSNRRYTIADRPKPGKDSLLGIA